MDETQIELELYDLMRQLKQVSLVMNDAVKTENSQVEALLKEIRTKTEPFYQESKVLQEKITHLALQHGKSLKTGSGNITYRKGGVRRVWDLDKLDEYCEKFKDIKDTIWHLREPKPFEPTVIIKVDLEGKSNADI